MVELSQEMERIFVDNLPRIQVLITTNDQYIEGELILPENMKFSNANPDNMLFYILNGGFQFLILKNCEVKDRKNLAFRPDRTAQLHVNLSCIITIQVIEVLSEDFDVDDDNVAEDIQNQQSNHVKTRTRR